MTLIIDHEKQLGTGNKPYPTILLDDTRIKVPYCDFFTLLVLSCRYLQGQPLVHHSDLWGELSLRYVWRTRKFVEKIGVPMDILSDHKHNYYLVPKEIDIQISSRLLLSEDCRVVNEVKKYLYATVGVASC